MSVDIGQAAERLAAQLGDRLLDAWREAFRAVPRHLFVPAMAWRIADGENTKHPIDWYADPGGWTEAAYSEDIVITRLDQDGSAISFCSMPYMVFAMLDLADIQPGQTVLEIGAGTGWSSALMACRIGSKNVTTVEDDHDVANLARRNHARAKVAPTVVTADGSEGYVDYTSSLAAASTGCPMPGWSRPGPAASFSLR